MNETRDARARDLMRTDVATLSADDTIEAALELFEESGISGAPVVANGRLVGMLTLADVGRTEHHKGGRIETESEYALSEPTGEERVDELDPAEIYYVKEDYSPDVLGPALVGDWMSRGVVSVSPEASLEEVCEVMVENQIHRVCVTEEGRLAGLITSFDVVRHVARGERTRRERRAGAPSCGARRPRAHGRRA